MPFFIYYHKIDLNCYLSYKVSHIYLKQTIGVGSNNGNVNHRQGDYTDIGSKATSHIPYQPMKNAASNKKMILEDHARVAVPGSRPLPLHVEDLGLVRSAHHGRSVRVA